MRNTNLAMCIAFASIGLFALGWCAGYNDVHEHNISIGTDSPYRVQWEVLLTGSFALIGGVLAYRGATAHLRHSQAVDAAAYLTELAHVQTFVSITDETTDSGREIFAAYRKGTTGPFADTAKVAADRMTGLPPSLATIYNSKIERAAYAGLYAVAYMGNVPRTELVVEVRSKCVKLIKLLDEYANA